MCVYREHHWHFDQTVFLSLFLLLLLRLMVMVCPSMVLGAAGCWQCSPSLISSSRRRHCCICCNNNNNHHLQGLVFSFLSFVFFFICLRFVISILFRSFVPSVGRVMRILFTYASSRLFVCCSNPVQSRPIQYVSRV